jgi:hypothetical protein
MKMLYITLMVLFLSGCQTIENKSQEIVTKENKKLSAFLQKPLAELKIVMGQPDEIVNQNNGSKFFIYRSKKYKITCERKFDINKNKIVVGFSSKGCF